MAPHIQNGKEPEDQFHKNLEIVEAFKEDMNRTTSSQKVKDFIKRHWRFFNKKYYRLTKDDKVDLFNDALLLFTSNLRKKEYTNERDKSIDAYFRGICRNIVKAWNRNRRHIFKTNPQQELEITEGDNNYASVKILLSCFHQLDEKCQSILQSIFFNFLDGDSSGKVSALINEPNLKPSAVAMRKKRCKDKIQKLYQNEIQ